MLAASCKERRCRWVIYMVLVVNRQPCAVVRGTTCVYGLYRAVRYETTVVYIAVPLPPWRVPLGVKMQPSQFKSSQATDAALTVIEADFNLE
jgi:hypothetical protein